MSRLYNNLMRNASFAFFILAIVSLLLPLLAFKQSFIFSITEAIWRAMFPLAIAAFLYRIDKWIEKQQ